MKYGSVCSGIEAATVAWEPLGWSPAWFSEIEKFPSEVLNHHYPEVPNHGDFTRIRNPDHPADRGIDVLVGGTPCQSFSVAGLRDGLSDDRGNLALEYCRLVGALRPRWFLWENVTGALSTNGGEDFGAILGAMAELGYGFAYRVLDARHFGVPQRRRRIFLVGHASGDFRGPATVLFEPDGSYRSAAPSRGSGEDTAGSTGDGLANRVTTGEGRRYDVETTTIIAEPSIGFGWMEGRNFRAETEVSNSLTRSQTQAVAANGRVRRLTPVECERLQGFPDNYTRIPWRGKPEDKCPDGHRYKALGNSMAVPVMRWIGHRISLVDAATEAA